jgi:hypothetical protein
MNEVTSKPWYESIGIWGAIIGVIGTVLSFFNVVLPEGSTDQAAGAVTQIVAAWSAKDYGSLLTGLMTLIGLIVSIVGRKQADQPVHFLKPYVAITTAPVAPATTVKKLA